MLCPCFKSAIMRITCLQTESFYLISFVLDELTWLMTEFTAVLLQAERAFHEDLFMSPQSNVEKVTWSLHCLVACSPGVFTLQLSNHLGTSCTQLFNGCFPRTDACLCAPWSLLHLHSAFRWLTSWPTCKVILHIGVLMLLVFPFQNMTQPKQLQLVKQIISILFLITWMIMIRDAVE